MRYAPAHKPCFLFLVLLLVQSGLKAQTESIVSVPNLLSAVAVTTPSAIVRNIGQNQHLATIRFVGGGGCVAGDVDIQFERSSNPTAGSPVWVPFGVKLSVSSASLVDLIYAYGPAEGTRVNPAAFDTVNCTLTVDYIGTIYPGNVDSFFRQSSYRFANINTAAGGDLAVVAARAGLRVCVYELFLWSPTGKTITLESGTAPAAGELSVPLLIPDNLGFVMDNQGVPRFCTEPGDSFNINISLATQLSGWANFRYEE